jgi:EAL domain-containing protein (putative c-di-GMP-specific phosphodiesterase class I)
MPHRAYSSKQEHTVSESPTRNSVARTTQRASVVSEPAYDAVTKLAAEYYQANSALLCVIEDDHVWVKSTWGCSRTDFPLKGSMCGEVVEAGCTVVVPDVREYKNGLLFERAQQFGACFVAGAPVRDINNEIIAVLIIGAHEPGEKTDLSKLGALERLAAMAASLLELEHLQLKLNEGAQHESLRSQRRSRAHLRVEPWPSPGELRRALDRNEFELYYQPEIELATHRIIGVEALIRWRHPEKGLIFPGQFIPIAEESGLILPIGRWGLREACSQIQRWNQRDASLKNMRVCVNLSARQFAQEQICEHIKELLDEMGISGQQLGIELTETSLISNIGTAVRVLSGLRQFGISLLMDDFGTGYSSLNYLQSFSFDVLKIDRSFISRMENGNSAQQIVRTIIELARVLGMEVVAEGIETMEQYKLLCKLGCRYGQGYLFARPMPANEVTKLLDLPGRIVPESMFDTNLQALKETA